MPAAERIAIGALHSRRQICYSCRPMPELSRRTVLTRATAFTVLGLSGIASGAPGGPALAWHERQPRTWPPPFGSQSPPFGSQSPSFGSQGRYAQVYGPVAGERYPIPAVNLSAIDPAYLRQEVYFPTREVSGTIIIDPRRHFLYHVQYSGRALRYGVGVGRQGFGWSGVASINSKQEWPDWYPPAEMLARQPEIMRQMSMLQSGLGMKGGLRNPLGARALYLWQNNKDTLYRIHGTIEPWTIGRSVSSGCIRMINQDVMHLYDRVPLGARVVVL
jgi:lipoprotein-anchoring transpeptidase ErfK/SrfK